MGETQPLTMSTYPAGPPPQEAIVKSTLSSMSKPVYLLDITFLSQLRKDGHPSKYSGANFDNDCTHWCLAGIPDTWNQLLYASMLQGKWEGKFTQTILFIIGKVIHHIAIVFHYFGRNIYTMNKQESIKIFSKKEKRKKKKREHKEMPSIWWLWQFCQREFHPKDEIFMYSFH